MNKKGSLFNMLELVYYVGLVIVVAVFIALAAFQYLNEDINTINMETFLLAKRLSYSDTCFAYSNDVRIYQGIVDLKKVNSGVATNCYAKKDFGYLVKIKELDGTVKKSASNLDQRQEAYLPICEKIKGVRCASRTNPILYYDNGAFKQGLMDVEVISFVQ